MQVKKRIIGFDLARAYAILGMYIVNFNMVFGNYNDKSTAGRFLSLFSGNSSTVFVMLAGMGLALMSNRPGYTAAEKSQLRSRIYKRAGFLLGLGLLLFWWWPADILHFYGGYMCVGAWLLFVNKKYYVYATVIVIIIFHCWLVLLPYETGWSLETLQYTDFWTVQGFIRNTLYNGWNALFPWLAYFIVGLYLGRLNWALPQTQRSLFLIGLVAYLSIACLQIVANRWVVDEDLLFFINADYLPPFLPFLLSTLGFGLMVIAFFMYISKYVSESKCASNLAKTGQMTLTHYISHVTVGMIVFAVITGQSLTTKANNPASVSPVAIFIFALAYFVASYYFSKLWAKKFKNGPFELLMRKISG